MTFVAPALSPPARNEALQAMAANELDVLVIGAGVVGAGAALDAATRGMRVGLVEARDYGSGTSSRSSKLIHGGLRYLKQLNFSLVFEALRDASSSCRRCVRTWPSRCRSSTRSSDGLGTGPGSVPASASTTCWVPDAVCPAI